jgi:hypothetical protein
MIRLVIDRKHLRHWRPPLPQAYRRGDDPLFRRSPVEHERWTAELSSDAIQRRDHSGLREDAALDAVSSWKVHEHDADENGQHPLTQSARDGKRKARRERDTPRKELTMNAHTFYRKTGSSLDRARSKRPSAAPPRCSTRSVTG